MAARTTKRKKAGTTRSTGKKVARLKKPSTRAKSASKKKTPVMPKAKNPTPTTGEG
jgi:hypothetical protein